MDSLSTSIKLRTGVVIAGAILLACTLGWMIGGGHIVAGIVLVTVAFILLGAALFAPGVRWDALVLSGLLVGYLIGNRGFAGLYLAENLYLGELGMLICFLLLGAYTAFSKGRIIPKVPLARVIVIFIVLGLLRLYADFPRYRLLALRDFATVYYSCFFIIAYNIALHARSLEFLKRVISVASALLIPLAILFILVPDALLRITIRGNPVFLQKGDILATFLAVGSILCFGLHEKGRFRSLWTVMSLVLYTLMVVLMARAAYVGHLAATGLLLLAGRKRYLRYQMQIVAVGAGMLLVLGATRAGTEGSRLKEISDEIFTMIDFSGVKGYGSFSGAVSAQNNRFRTFWWREVYAETMETSPLTGMGFGYDLSQRFLRTYELPLGANFDARSPHSIVMTLFGRMGLMGLLSFGAIVVVAARMAWRTASLVREGRVSTDPLVFYCAALVVFGSACFGVVLEGPMGAVVFWSFLGFAAAGNSMPARAADSGGRKTAIKEDTYPKLRPVHHID